LLAKFCNTSLDRGSNDFTSGPDLPVGYVGLPRASRSKGASIKLWYAQSHLPVYDQHFMSKLVMKFSFIHLIRFRVDNTRVFQWVFMNLNMTVGQAACRL